jgi:alkylation response protein AidB-like acyl-CoA dehydrogenase
MDFELSTEQKAIVDSLGTLLSRHAGPKRAIELQRSGEYDHALHSALAEAGFLGIYHDTGALEAALVIEQVAKAAGVVSVGASALLAPALTLSGERCIAVAADDLHAPSRFAGDASTLLQVSGTRVTRVELGEGDVERVASSFMYPLGRVRSDREPRRIPLSVSPEHASSLWRLALAAECVGTMDGALSLTVEYVKQRRQFGRSIGSFQAVQHRLALARVQLDGARYLTYEAAHRNGDPEASATAAAYATHAARLVHTETHQLTGALGFTREHDLHVWSMRLSALRIELGGTAAHRRALAGARWGLSP